MGKIIESYFGNYYEDFNIGDTYLHTPHKTITESDNNIFTLLTMNHHPLHIDATFSSNSQHHQILVVGTLVFSLVVGLSVKDISAKAIANLEYEQIVHHAPVFIGDTIRAETIIIDKKESSSKKDRGIIYVETKGLNQNNIKVISFRRKVLIPKKIS